MLADKVLNHGHKIIITTHSPYILSAFNNLLYAYQVSAKTKSVAHVINEKFWIDSKSTAVYFMSEAESIIDKELQLIKAEIIDSASQIINDEYNKLFDMDN